MSYPTRADLIAMDDADYRRHAVPQGFDPRVTRACGVKSDLYEMFPDCRDCGEYVCEDCEAAGTRQEREERMDTVLCRTCADPHVYDAQDALDDAADWAYDTREDV